MPIIPGSALTLSPISTTGSRTTRQNRQESKQKSFTSNGESPHLVHHQWWFTTAFTSNGESPHLVYHHSLHQKWWITTAIQTWCTGDCRFCETTVRCSWSTHPWIWGDNKHTKPPNSLNSIPNNTNHPIHWTNPCRQPVTSWLSLSCRASSTAWSVSSSSSSSSSSAVSS